MECSYAFQHELTRSTKRSQSLTVSVQIMTASRYYAIVGVTWMLKVMIMKLK